MSQRTDTSQAPRIAIKFSAGSSTPKPGISSKSQAPSKPSSALGKRQRSHAFGHDSDSEEDDEFGGKPEAVTSFGVNGAEDDDRRKDSKTTSARSATTPFVISGHKNRDWKSEAKARKTGKNILPHEVQAQARNGSLKETEPADQDKQIKWGLTIKKQASPEPSTDHRNGAKEDEKHGTNDGTDSEGRPPEQPDNPDDDAMNALLGKKRKSAKDFVIEATSKRDETPQFSEEDAYQRGVEEAAEVSTIEEYDAIPEGEFGAAMLRGMGWKGEERAPKPKAPTRRPHLMGLGAKEDEELKKAEMAKKHGHRERRPRLDEYRASKEGERRSRDDRRPDSYKSERDRERQGSSNHGHRDREHHRDRDRDRERDNHRNRDRHHRR